MVIFGWSLSQNSPSHLKRLPKAGDNNRSVSTGYHMNRNFLEIVTA
jgi:hypothetical protein